MSREIKFGLLLVVGLTSVFGFMVYKRLHEPPDLAAETAGENPERDATAAPAGPVLGDPQGNGPGVVTAEGTAETTANGSAVQVLTVGDEKTAPALGGEDPFAEPVKPAPQPVRKPAPATTTFDPFAGDAQQPVRVSPSRTIDATKPEVAIPDPFAAETVKAATNNRTKLPPALPAETDPFTAEVKAAPVLSRPTAAPLSLPANDDPFGAPRSVKISPSKNEATAASTTVIERRAPVELELDLSEPVARPVMSLIAKPIGANAPAGPTYVIQPEDNYWMISKKVYGTGRYFQALLKHNEQVIPDPQKMKPGVEIATPAVAELEAHYPELIPDLNAGKPIAPVAIPTGDAYVTEAGDNFWIISKKVYGTGRYFQALAEHNKATIPNPLKLQSGTTVQTPPADELQARYTALLTGNGTGTVMTASTADPVAADGDAPGFFIGPNDQPQYRVGTDDTLSGIARAHLGRASRWVQVLEMNRDVLIDGNTLKVGSVLRLPADASQVQAVGFDRTGR